MRDKKCAVASIGGVQIDITSSEFRAGTKTQVVSMGSYAVSVDTMGP